MACSASTTLRYYHSTDAMISTADTEVGTDTVGALTAAGTSDESIDLTAPSTAGTYYYGACVDPVSGESNSQNNCSSAVRVTVTATGRGEDTVTRAEFEASTQTDYVGVTLSDNGSVWGIPEKYTSDSSHGTVAYMLLGTMKGCSFANAEADGSSKAYIKTQQLGSLSNYESVSVCRKTSRSWNSFAGTRMTHLRFFDESSPTNIREYVYDAATGRYDETIPPAPAPSPASGLMVEGFDLASGNHGSAGIAFANNRFYVVDGGSRNRGRPAKVYVYLASGQREPAADFDLHEDNDWPLAITFANNRFFVPDWRDNKVYAYQTSGQRDSASDFDLDAAQRYDVEGIAFTNNRFYVVDQGDAKVYAYQSSGPRDSASDFNLDSANSSPKGIAFGNDRLYVVDDSNDRIYAYQTSGQRDSASDFDLDADYAEGITFANDALYVVIGSFGYKVFAVKLTDQFPDLLVESPSVSDANPGSAGAFVFSATVRNRGTEASAATTLRYYRSDNRTITTSDTEVGMSAVGVLPAAATSSQTITLTAPSSAGTYYYGACVDPVPEESNTRNNCSSAVVVATPRPDLVVESPSVSDDTPETSESFVFSATVRNRGTEASAATTLRYYRSDNRTITTSDTEVGMSAVGVLPAAATSSQTITLTAPSSAGTYYYGACVDPVPEESNTRNNCSSAVVVATPRPDLVVESPSVSDDTPETSESFVFTATVRNRGNKASSATTLRYYRSDDRTISTSDTQVGTDAVSALSVDETVSATVSLPAPSTEGTYYYGACVDSVSGGEISTENNCSSAVTVFGGGPFPAYDLMISSTTLHAPGIAVIGQTQITMTVEVTNSGPNASRPAQLRFGNSVYRTIPVLDPDETVTFERQRVGYAGLGTTTYRACIVEAPGEENTANNCRSRSVTYE